MQHYLPLDCRKEDTGDDTRLERETEKTPTMFVGTRMVGYFVFTYTYIIDIILIELCEVY